jgi:HK97 family phage major capsid protein
MARKYHPAQRAQAGDKPVYPLACRIRAEAGVTRIDVFDDIGEGGWLSDGVSAKDFAAQLAGIKGALSLHLNSCGGDVWDGLAIFNTIRGHKGPVTVTVDGLAASIASVIVQAGGERVMAPGAMLMIHDAFAVAVGNEAELAKTAQTLGQVSDNLAGVYAARAGGSQQRWRQAMREETWYTAEEAVAVGLADKVGERPATLPESVDLAALGVVPGRIAARLREMPSAGDAAAVREALHGGLRAAGLKPATPVRQQGPVLTEATPGAKLDGYPWAASWGKFLAAISDEGDRLGARAVIARAMQDSRPRAAAGMSERIPAEGGFLVPERLRAQILTFMTGAVIRPRAQVIQMDSLTVPIPMFENLDQADGAQALGGMTFAWTEESAAITPTAPEFGVIELEAHKAAGYLQAVPNELCDDSAAFSDVFLPRIIAQGLSWFEDDYFTNGTGVGEPQGLLNAPGALTITRTTSDEVLVADIVACLKALHPQSKRGGAVWLLDNDTFNQLLDLALLTGDPTTGVSTPQEWLRYSETQNCWTLLGLPAFPTDHQGGLGASGDVILADLSLLLIGDRQELLVERSQKGSGFISGTSNFRVKARLDSRYWPQNSITLASGSVVSPLVILGQPA